MSLIHEELYKDKGVDSLDFAAYLRKLTADVFNSYNLGNKDIWLKLNLEQVDGCIELKRDKGTEFTIWFNN